MLKIIATLKPEASFTRHQLRTAAENADLTSVVDDPGAVSYSWRMLENVIEDGYAVVNRGDGALFLADPDANEDADELGTASSPSECKQMARQILRREGLPVDMLNSVSINYGDYNDVQRKLMDIVDRPVVWIRSNPNWYRLRDEGAEIVRDRLDKDNND